MSGFINIYSLPKKKTARERNRLHIYERILRKCHHRIKYTAEHSSSGDMYTFFEIPAIIPGMPIYDILSCTDFLIHKLSSNGFKVLNLGTNLLFISWQHIEFDPNKEQQMEDRLMGIKDIPVREPSLGTRQLTDSSQTESFQFDIPAKPMEFKPVHETPSTEKFLLI